MADSLRDLVVSLSLDSDNFTRNIKSVNKQIQEAQSYFKLAAAGEKDFESTSSGLTTKLSTLEQKLKLQKEVVNQYQRSLEQASAKLRECYERQEDYNGRLTAAQAEQSRAHSVLNDTVRAYETLRDVLGEDDEQTQQFKSEIAGATQSYLEATENVAKLSGQCDALQRASQNAADGVSTVQTQLNNASAAVKDTEAAIADTNQALALAQTSWQAAQADIDQADKTIASIGGSMKLAESEFKLATAGMKNAATSVGGLSAKLDLLKKKYDLQKDAIEQYKVKLEATEEQLRAAQEANDPEKIDEATEAVKAAQAELNNAQAELKDLEAEINDTNTQLRVASSAWTQAGEALASFGERLRESGEEATRFGQALTNAISKKVYAFAKDAVNASMEFESSFALVRKTVNGTEEDYDKLAAASKRLSTEIATSTTEINKVMATGGQLGIATEHIEDFAKTMIDLSIASTDLDADTAATQLSKFANIMGTDQSLFSNMGSTIAMLGNNFATTEAPIAEMAMRIAGAGKQVGLTEAQVLGLATALSSVGIQAQAGGSSISKMLINMEVAAATGGDALTDFAKIAGMSEAEFVEAWGKDPIAVFQQFISNLAAMSDEGVSTIAVLQDMGIKEIRLRDTMLRAVNATELFANAQTMATAAWEENTALGQKAATRYNTTASQMTNLKNKATLLYQTVGDDLNPTFEKLIKLGSELMDKLLGLESAQRQQIMKWAGIVAAIGPVILIYGKVTKGIGAVIKAVGTFMTTVGAAGGGVTGLLSVLAHSPAVWFAVAAAAVAGTIALIDWVSGAKAAREATKALNDEAQRWIDTQANTLYDTGNADPLARFGLSKDDFSYSGLKDAQTWRDSLIQVWTDGEKETDDIVKQFTEGFTSGSEEIRKAITAQSDLLNDYDVMTPEAKKQLDDDLALLDSWDKEVEALLKKRQNGFLTEAEQARLNQIISQRAEIQLKYSLDTDDGYEQILTQMEAAIERAEHGGRVDAALFGDTLNALAEGRKAYMDALDGTYNAEYAQIQLIQDETARTAALDELNQRYNARRVEGEEAYADSVRAAATAAWKDNGYEEQIKQLDELAALMGDSENLSIPAIKDMAEGLDEGKLTSMIALVEQLKAAGLSDSEMADLGIDYDDILSKIEQIRNLAGSTEGLEGLSTIFGTALPEEIQRIMIGLDMTQAAEDWAAFAEGGSLAAIKANVMPNPIEANTVAVTGLLTVGAELGSVVGKNGVTYKVTDATVNADGTLASVTTEDGKTYTVTSENIKADGTLASVTGADGVIYPVTGANVKADAVLATVTGEDGVTYKVTSATVKADGTVASVTGENGVTYYVTDANILADGTLGSVTGRDGTVYKVTGVSATVDANLGTVTGEDGKTYKVISAEVGVDGTLKTVTAEDGKTYSVNADITASCSIKLSPLDQAAIDAWEQANTNKKIAGPKAKVGVQLGADWASTLKTAYEAGLLEVWGADGAKIDVTPDVISKITANDVAVYDTDGTLHVMITPDISTPEGVEAALNAADSDGPAPWWRGFAPEKGTTEKIESVAKALETLNGAWTPLQRITYGSNLNLALESLNDQDLGNIATEAAALMAALSSGELDTETADAYIARLQSIADLVSTADTYKGSGNNISKGIAEGMKNYDYTGDATTLATDIQTSIDNALGAHSPATKLIPTGTNAAMGIAKGMTDYNFTASSASTATNVKSALTRSLGAGALRSIGVNAMLGLASGIRNGQASVVTAIQQAARAAVQAAQQALQINSPSRVFRDEVGAMVMKGFGEGIEEETENQAKTIANAARYLTDSAKDSAIAYGGTDNRKTYNNSSSVNLSGNNFYIRDEQDIRSLAVEIATLTKRQQRGKGLRTA